MNSKTKIYALGLGPGDPDLISVKGLKALNNAEIIFYPVADIENPKKSFSYQILKHYNLSAKLCPMHFPMIGKNIDEYYVKAYQEIIKATDINATIAIVSEGDLLFYSTFGYLLSYFKADNIAIDLIPGIPAFILAGTLSNEPLVEKEQTLKVIAKPKSFEQINKGLQHNSTLVIMKLKVLKGWYEYLKKENLKFFYVERVGTPDYFGTSDIGELEDRKIPYFAILLIYKN